VWETCVGEPPKVPRYLEKRRRRWYAVLDIPKALRPAFNGKARFVQSLGTDSLSEAERKVGVVISGWKAELHAARTGTRQAQTELFDLADGWRETLAYAKTEKERDGIEMVLIDQAEKLDAKSPGLGVRAFKLATGQLVQTTDHIQPFLLTLQNEAKTLDMKRSDLHRFAKRFPLTRDVNHRALQRWAHELQHEENLKATTVRRIISTCRGYWDYLQRVEIVEEGAELFRNLVPPAPKKSKVVAADKRKPFRPSEVVALLAEARRVGDPQLADLILLGMYTGCRIEELCALRVEDVSADRITIRDAKTEAGLREVPLHSALQPRIKDICSASEDGYVLSGLTRKKYGDRSNAIGKRFGRLKTRLGFGTPYVFHSIRKTVATLLDTAQVPEAVSARILGHEIPTMTYGLYSGGAPFEVKREAFEKVVYRSGEAGADAATNGKQLPFQARKLFTQLNSNTDGVRIRPRADFSVHSFCCGATQQNGHPSQAVFI